MCDKCIFCDSDVTRLGEYAVCEKCKTVCLTKGMKTETIYHLITEYLSKQQERILLKHDAIHELDQKRISGSCLTDEEDRVYNCLQTFQDCRITLEFAANNHLALKDKKLRHALYELIQNEEQLDLFLSK